MQFQKVQLLLQLAIAVQAAGIEFGIADGTAGLLGVSAVAKTALQRQLDDVGEGGIDALGIGPELQLTQTGEIHQKAVAGHADELTMGGGVAPLAVGVAHVGGALSSAFTMVDLPAPEDPMSAAV